MSIKDREKVIRERRTIEAAKKNLLGTTGKLGTIARYLGHPIRYQGSGLDSTRSIADYLGEPYQEDAAPEDLPVFDGDSEWVETIGYIFDGLGRGLHLEIKYIDDQKSLTVHWKGYPMYREVAGDLAMYAPFPEWEQPVDRLYQQARAKAVEHRAREHAAAEEESKRKQASFLQRLRLRWGI